MCSYIKYCAFVFSCFFLTNVSFGFQVADSIKSAKSTISDQQIIDLFDISISDILNVDIVSASQKKQSVLEAPANATIVTKEQIELRGYSNLLELLQDVPQVEFQINADSEYRNTITIRGVTGNEKVLILLNGNRITPSTGDFYVLGNQFMINHAERVEIIIGPASALYGVDAFAGIVNIVTAGPLPNSQELDFSSAVGNYGTSNLAYSYAVNTDKFTFTVAGQHNKSEEPNYADLDPNLYIWYNNQYKPYGRVLQNQSSPNIYLIESFENDAGDSFWGNSISRDFNMSSFSNSFFTELKVEDITIGYQRMVESHSSSYGVDSRYTAYDGEAKIKTVQDVLYFNHSYLSFDNRLSVQSNLSLNLFEIDPSSHFANARSLWQRGYIYSYSYSGKWTEQVQFQANSQWNLTGGINVEVLSSLPRTALIPRPYDKNKALGSQDLYYVGTAGYLPLLYEDSNDPYINLTNYTGYNATFNDSLTFEQDIYFVRFQNTGAYFQAIYTPSKLIDFILSTRYDVNSRYGSSFNPRIGAVFRNPSSSFYFKALYGESFLAPSPSKTYKQDGSFSGNETRVTDDIEDRNVLYTTTYHLPNPDLRPEKLKTFEINSSAIISDNISLNLNAFSTKITDYINLFAEVVPLYTVPNIYCNNYTMSVNQGGLEIYGFSGGAQYFIKSDLGRFNLYSNYSYIDGAHIDANEEIPLLYQAKHTLKSGVEFQAKKWSVSFRNLGRSGSLGVSERLDKNPDFNTLNVNGSFSFTEKEHFKLRLTAEANNVFNATYYNVYYGGSDGMPRILQDPVRYMFGLKVDLK